MLLHPRSPDIIKSLPKCYPKKGFTLVELLMTIVVLSIVSIPMSILISEHFLSVVQSSEQVMALNLARFEMEKVGNMDYATVGSVSVSDYEGYPYDIDRTVTFVQGDSASTESLKQIQVDVKSAGSSVILFRLKTYLAKNVGYGI